MAYKQPSSGSFKLMGSSPAKQTSKDVKHDIQINKMMKKKGWNEGKKVSDYTPEELARIRDPKYQADLSRKVDAEINANKKPRKERLNVKPGSTADIKTKAYKKKDTPIKQKLNKGGEAQDQDKIYDKKGNHIGTYVNGKKVMHSFTKQVEDIILPEGFEKVQKSYPRSKSMAKQKDFLDATEQQQRIESSRVDLKEKKYLSDLKMGKLKHKNRNRIIGGPGAS